MHRLFLSCWDEGIRVNLAEKQRRFPLVLARLLLDLDARGYEVTMGECWRTNEQAQWNSLHGKGITNSLHCVRLAVDLNLFKDGRYLVRTEEYAEAGSLWESYSTDEYQCVWGGAFGDGNHFSISHGGVR